MMYNPEAMICDWEDNVLKLKPSCDKTEKSKIKKEKKGQLELQPKCPPGQMMEECAIECHRLCSYYLFIVREKGLCSDGTKCESGCVSAEKRPKCPQGSVTNIFSTIDFFNEF